MPVTGWRGMIFIDRNGYVWEWAFNAPHPICTNAKVPFAPLEPVPAPTSELHLTDADLQLLADLKVTV
jgi:hypothetical protein